MPIPDRSRLLSWTAEALRHGSRGADRLASRLHEATSRPKASSDEDLLAYCVERDVFEQGVGTALGRLRHSQGTVGVIAVTIDQFTALIASHGASAGNEVLQTVASRLRDGVRPKDLVTRVGGDGFALLWKTDLGDPESQGRQNMIDVATRLARRFDTPITTSAGEIRVAVSIGTAAVTDGEVATTDEATLMQQASTAVATAKNSGRAQVVTFDLSMEQQAVQKYQTENDLRAALHNDEVNVHYQPIHSFNTGAVVAVEALPRWQHEAMGSISPGLFIPVAEESGLINELGARVMATTLRQGAQWACELDAPPLVTLNLSGHQLLDRDLVHTIDSLLREHQLDATRLCLEITESVVMNDVAASMTILGLLKDLGLCLAIDDFGTGYSSLSYLRRLPVDILKIDRSFVHTIYNRDDRMIVKAIIDLAHTLGMTTVAEGIETRLQIEVLDTLDCDMAQGFLLHAPARPEDLDMTPVDFSARPATVPMLDSSIRTARTLI